MMCLTTTSHYCNSPPNMIHEDITPTSPTSTLRSPGLPGSMEMLLGSCDVSSKTSSMIRKTAPSCNKEIDSSLFVLDLDDEEGDMAEVSLMNSISLDDSNHFMDLDLDGEESDKAPSSSCAPLHDSPFFDNKQQKFEWNEDFSMLIKLKRTRMPTIVEDDQAPMFACAARG